MTHPLLILDEADSYRFTNSNEIGEVQEPGPRTYARFAMLDEHGKIIPIAPPSIPLDVWGKVLDKSTKEPTGYVKRLRMRTLQEVFADLSNALDCVVCDRCGDEQKVPDSSLPYPWAHSGCGGEYESFIDEYFSGPNKYGCVDHYVPHDYQWVACYPVTGVSEGHYVHVGFICPVKEVKAHDSHRQTGFDTPLVVRPTPDQGLVREVRLALGKTFRGMAHAAEMARRCAVLLGA